MDESALPLLIQAMMQPGFYAHPVGKVTLLQTHISWLLLAGDYAYKVKKAVNLGFVDFSSVALRGHFCHQELRLNRRLAPALYLEVMAIGCQSGEFVMPTDGEAVEYCLQMRRFDQHDLLQQRLQDGALDPRWIDDVARQIATLHRRGMGNCEVNAAQTAATLWQQMRDNLLVAGNHLCGEDDGALLKRLDGQRMAWKKRLGKLLATRDGYICDGHGDLHLRNIALYQGAPCIFDCIEFNSAFRTIDTMNDLAFLWMDCRFQGRDDLAFRLLSRYLERMDDDAGLALLPLYASYRAGVRAKVACLRSSAPSLSAVEQEASIEEACRYLQLAARCAQQTEPSIYAVGGLSASGKSTLALAGCGIAQAVVVRSDATRKALAHRFPDLPLYGNAMGARTYAAMLERAERIVDSGYSVILDATFLQPASRDAVRGLAQRLGVPCHFLWLELPAERLRQRILARQQAGNDISDADLAVLEQQLLHYTPPQEDGIQRLSGGSWPDDRP